jgi:hypothetical protein
MSSPNDPGVSAERNAVIVASNALSRIGGPPVGSRSQSISAAFQQRREVGCLAQRHAKQRPKKVEDWAEEIELKARSQPTGTCLPARSSCDLRPFLTCAGAVVGRSLLSARLTCCGLKSIPCALGNDGNEMITIEQIAAAITATRTTVLFISLSHPESLDRQTIRIALSSAKRRYTNV